MPIYEYYCKACHGRYRHLARRIDEDAPPCPRCGHQDVERLVSTVNMVHSTSHHEEALKQEVAQVDGDDMQATARFLKQSGRLEDASGLFGSSTYRELIERRIEGATDADLGDLVDDLAAEAASVAASSEVAQIAGALALSKQVENRMGAEGPPEGHEHSESAEGSEHRPTQAPSSRHAAEDLGWG